MTPNQEHEPYVKQSLAAIEMFISSLLGAASEYGKSVVMLLDSLTKNRSLAGDLHRVDSTGKPTIATRGYDHYHYELNTTQGIVGFILLIETNPTLNEQPTIDFVPFYVITATRVEWFHAYITPFLDREITSILGKKAYTLMPLSSPAHPKHDLFNYYRALLKEHHGYNDAGIDSIVTAFSNSHLTMSHFKAIINGRRPSDIRTSL